MSVQADVKEETMVEWFENSYNCSECGAEWIDEWSCMCDDRCPECDAEIEPTSSVDLSRPLTDEDYAGARRLMSSSSELSHLAVSDEDAKDYAEGMLEGGEYRFSIRRA